MNQRQLRYILEIAKQGNLTSASKALYISQPSLSNLLEHVEQDIKACEEEMERCGAREVELDNEINSPEVYNDPQLLRQKSDELEDLRFHQEELFAVWEAAVEEQEQYERSLENTENAGA